MRKIFPRLLWAVLLFALVSAPQLSDTLSPIRFYAAPVAITYRAGQVTPLFRQPDGSYTALDFGILSPFLKASSTPNYQLQVLAGLPGSGAAGPAAVPTYAPGAASQPGLFADLAGDGTLAAVIPFQVKTPLLSSATVNDILVILAGPDFTYKSLTPYTVAPNVTGILTADFNGDRIPDLVVTALGDAATPGGVFVLLGSGGGAFRKAAAVTTGGTALQGAAAGDLNGDGKPDLLVADAGGNRVIAVLGNGDGTFKAPAAFAAGSKAGSVAIADLNGDGKLDAVVANPGANNVSVLLGNGDGTLRAASNFAAGAGAAYPAIGDLNGDGVPDVAVANADANSVSILLGKGDGSFGAASHYAGALAPTALVLTDFNNDGKLDVVMGHGNNRILLPGYESLDVQVLLGNGDGTLDAAPSLPLAFTAGPFNTPSVALGDFNGDGKLDIVSTIQSNDEVAITLAGKSAPFGASASYSLKPPSGRAFPNAIAAGDLNGDGKADIVTANTLGNSVAVGIGNGTGGFQLPVFYPAGAGPSGVAIADLNKDGRPDLIVSNFSTNRSASGVSVLLAQTGGGFQAPVLYAAGTGPAAVAASDLNGDGVPDAVVVNGGAAGDPGGVSVLLANANGTLNAAANYTSGANPSGVAIADFNGDGRPDLAVATRSQVALLTNNGNGTFRAAVMYPTEVGAVNLAARDFDGDGKMDLAVTHCCGSTALTVFRGNGDGTFAPEVRVNAGSSPNAIAAGDLDGDNRPDLVVVDTPISGGNALVVLLNRSLSGPAITSVRSSTGGDTIAPNTWLEIKGQGLASATRLWDGSDFNGSQMPTQLNGVGVTIGGKTAFVEYISPTQVNVLTPADLAPGTAQVVLTSGGAQSAPVAVRVDAQAPGFFLFGSGPYAAAVHTDGSYLGPTTLYPGYTTPAKPGEVVLLFGNGFGQTTPALVNGSAAQAGTLPSLPVFRIGGAPATVQFAGVVSPGLYQFNVVVPDSTPDGDQTLTVTYNGAASPSGVLLSVRR